MFAIAAFLAAVRFPNRVTVCLSVTITVASLASSLIASLVCFERIRAFAVGFFIGGATHFLIAFAELFGLYKALLSTLCLHFLGQRLGYTFGPNPYVEDEILKEAFAGYALGSGPDQYYKFMVIGHCFATVVVGIAFGTLARWLRSRSST